jgi:hypothetical protein
MVRLIFSGFCSGSDIEKLVLEILGSRAAFMIMHWHDQSPHTPQGMFVTINIQAIGIMTGDALVEYSPLAPLFTSFFGTLIAIRAARDVNQHYATSPQFGFMRRNPYFGGLLF